MNFKERKFVKISFIAGLLFSLLLPLSTLAIHALTTTHEVCHVPGTHIDQNHPDCSLCDYYFSAFDVHTKQSQEHQDKNFDENPVLPQYWVEMAGNTHSFQLRAPPSYY